LDPSAVGVGDFGIEPDERSADCPPGEICRFPARTVFGFVVVVEVDDR
jgi:hypothetical protein